MASYRHTESALIHGGNTIDPLTGAVNIPIYQTSTFQQKWIGLEPEWEYARTGNPTRAALAAVRKLAESGARGTIVTVFPDRGDRYFSKGLYGEAAD